MKKAHLMLGFVLFSCGCGGARTGFDRNAFSFDYGDGSYEIISIPVTANRGGNFLLLREGGKYVLRARDVNQDGVLDTLLFGHLSLERANQIYAAGLAEARAGGRYKTRKPSRIFELYQAENIYAIRTHVLGSDAWYNEFTFFDSATNDGTILLDADANGVLDGAENEERDVGKNQQFYETALTEGLRTGRIVLVDNRYRVKPAAP